MLASTLHADGLVVLVSLLLSWLETASSSRLRTPLTPCPEDKGNNERTAEKSNGASGVPTSCP